MERLELTFIVISSTTAMRLLSRQRAARPSLPLRTWRWMRPASACSSTIAVLPRVLSLLVASDTLWVSRSWVESHCLGFRDIW